MMSEGESPFWLFFSKLGRLLFASRLEPDGVTLLDPLEISDLRL